MLRKRRHGSSTLELAEPSTSDGSGSRGGGADSAGGLSTAASEEGEPAQQAQHAQQDSGASGDEAEAAAPTTAGAAGQQAAQHGAAPASVQAGEAAAPAAAEPQPPSQQAHLGREAVKAGSQVLAAARAALMDALASDGTGTDDSLSSQAGLSPTAAGAPAATQPEQQQEQEQQQQEQEHDGAASPRPALRRLSRDEVWAGSQLLSAAREALLHSSPSPSPSSSPEPSASAGTAGTAAGSPRLAAEAAGPAGTEEQQAEPPGSQPSPWQAAAAEPGSGSLSGGRCPAEWGPGTVIPDSQPTPSPPARQQGRSVQPGGTGPPAAAGQAGPGRRGSPGDAQHAEGDGEFEIVLSGFATPAKPGAEASTEQQAGQPALAPGSTAGRPSPAPTELVPSLGGGGPAAAREGSPTPVSKATQQPQQAEPPQQEQVELELLPGPPEQAGGCAAIPEAALAVQAHQPGLAHSWGGELAGPEPAGGSAEAAGGSGQQVVAGAAAAAAAAAEAKGGAEPPDGGSGDVPMAEAEQQQQQEGSEGGEGGGGDLVQEWWREASQVQRGQDSCSGPPPAC